MSAGSQALERSTLEAKDRESLIQIATAMGGKPASRAKKADIIDLVLELAGVSPAAEEAAPVDAPDDAEATADATDGDAGADGEATGSEGNDDDPADDDHQDQDQDEDRNQGPSDRTSRDDDRADRFQDANGAGTDDGAATGSSGGQQNGAATREDGESGNRRRRRRGRDRDRNREGGQPGQPGQQAGQTAAPGQAPAPAANDDQWQGEPVEVAGLLDLRDEGYGFLRLSGYLPSRDDVYVSVKQVRQFGLRKGDHIKGASRPAARNEKNPALLRIDEINDADPDLNRDRRRFDDLTAQHPTDRLVLERDAADVTGRIIDLVAPIGKGQRGLIVAPPRSGKTTVVKEIARSIEANHPDVHLMVVLLDERPEEVNDMTRSVQGEVVASTFDRPADEHTMVAELALERAKRLVEEGKDVVILIDGITRLARAYSLAAPATGRVLAGTVDTGAIYPPKRFFGAARNAEEGGSLTILATILVGTGSTTDQVIFEEFEGTANSELHLDRRLADRRVFPAVDIDGSSSRNEELLFAAADLAGARALRRTLTELGETGDIGAGLELLLDRVSTTTTNEALLADAAKRS